MSKKHINTSERDTSASQSLGDLLKQAGVDVPRQHVPEDPKSIENIPGAPQKESLHLRIEKKGRGGKVVTIVSNFSGKTGVIEDLAAKLKTQCGVGGSVKDREIVLQGDLRSKVDGLLKKLGYRVGKM